MCSIHFIGHNLNLGCVQILNNNGLLFKLFGFPIHMDRFIHVWRSCVEHKHCERAVSWKLILSRAHLFAPKIITKGLEIIDDSFCELPFNKLYGFLNHSFPNGTCQTGSTDSSCPEFDVNLRTGECYLSSILLTIFAKQYLKVRAYRESEKSNAIHVSPQHVEGSSCGGVINALKKHN